MIQNQIVGILLKEKRQFTIRVMTHLARVFSIISANTVDPAHREPCGLAAYCDRDPLHRRDDKFSFKTTHFNFPHLKTNGRRRNNEPIAPPKPATH